MMCSPQVKNVIFIYTREHRGTTRKIAGKHNYEKNEDTGPPEPIIFGLLMIFRYVLSKYINGL